MDNNAITLSKLKGIIFNSPLNVAARAGKDDTCHAAASWAGQMMQGALEFNTNETNPPLAVFLKEEQEQLTNPELTLAVKVKLREIYDEVRAELRRQDVEVPDRDESRWVGRVSEYSSQKSFDPNKGYTRGGD